MRDKRGREIKIGSRVSVSRRPATSLLGADYVDPTDGKFPLLGFRGRVIRLDSDEVCTIREFDSQAWRTVRMEHVKVQYGESAESRLAGVLHEKKPAKKAVKAPRKPRQIVRRKGLKK
jgi:hypothetical protein